MTEIQKKLFELRDAEYALFQAKLAPTIAPESFIGVRLPQLRQLAKELAKTPECTAFLASLPHRYYDENLLHSILLESHKGFEETLELVQSFLPYVDNWAVCDTLRPKVFKKHLPELLPTVKAWIDSPEVYTCRFGLDMLMTYYLDDAFDSSYLELAVNLKSDDYYVRMMAAWYYATALAKQWDAALPYIEEHRLPPWTHRKTIQKAVESYRITPEQKEYLKTFRD